MKKERLFYLDFIRAIAVILILMTHYNALFLYMNPQPLDKVVITYRICNLYIGDFGISLFFIISGASLMYVYEKQCRLIDFYKKRFWSIYPMFWILYLIAFCVQKIVYQADYSGIPKYNFIWTILGFDGYVTSVLPTFFIIGEWFLGTIILVYVVFPFLRWGVNKQPFVFGLALIVIYLLAIYCYCTNFSKEALIGVRLPEVYFGMLYSKYIKKTNWKVAAICFIILVGNALLSPAFNSNIQTTYVGISAFLFLTYIAKFIQFNWLSRICAFLTKYSYVIFLIHHYIIYKVTEHIDFYQITTEESMGIFLICVIIILVASVLLYYVCNGIINTIKKGYQIIKKRYKGR